jgi:hypothetical protein
MELWLVVVEYALGFRGVLVSRVCADRVEFAFSSRFAFASGSGGVWRKFNGVNGASLCTL